MTFAAAAGGRSSELIGCGVLVVGMATGVCVTVTQMDVVRWPVLPLCLYLCRRVLLDGAAFDCFAETVKATCGAAN